MTHENSNEHQANNTGHKDDAETGFHMAFGWLAALSVSIAAAALAVIA